MKLFKNIFITAALLVGTAQASEKSVLSTSARLGIAAGLVGWVGGSLMSTQIQKAIEPNISNYKKADGTIDSDKWNKRGYKRKKYKSAIGLGLLATSSAAINLALFAGANSKNSNVSGREFAASSTLTQLAIPGLLITAGAVAGTVMWKKLMWSHHKGNGVYWF